MITSWKSGIAALALTLSMLAGRSVAEDIPASPEELVKVIAEAGKPGPEHAKLQPLAGNWTYTGKFWMEPGKPPIETKGTIDRKWILGGRFLEEKVAGTGFDGKPGFEGFGMLGYDNVQKKFTANWVCSMGTGTSTGEGVAEPSDSFTFQTTCSCPVMKKTVHGREQIRIESKDKIVMESYMNLDGKETKMMEIVALRKK